MMLSTLLPISRFYCFGRLIARFSFETPQLEEAVDRFLACHRYSETTSNEVALQIEFRTDASPLRFFPAEHFRPPPLIRFDEIQGWRESGRFHFISPLAAAMVEEPQGSGGILIHPVILDDPRFLTHTFLVLVLILILRMHGYFYLHAAWLTSPGGKSLFIAGNRRSGKSTLTCRLIRAGYGAHTDDALFIHRSEGLTFIPFMKDFHVPANIYWEDWNTPAARMRLPSSPEIFAGKIGIPWEHLGSLPAVPISKRVDCIVFPEIHGQSNSTWSRVGATETLKRLIAQSPYFGLDAASNRAQFQVLSQMSRISAAFSLCCGMDLLSNPDKAEKIFSEMMNA